MRWISEHFYFSYVPWRLLGLLLLIGLLINIYYLLSTVALSGTTRPDAIAYGVGAIAILYSFLLGVLCCVGLRRHTQNSPDFKRRTRQHLSPLLVAAGLWCFSLSQVVWVCVMLVTQQFPAFPSLEHFTELAVYPCLIGAILLLPARNLSWWSRLRVFLDALMIQVAVVTLCYYFLVMPLLVNGEGTHLEKIIAGTFIGADLVLLFCVLLVALQSGEPVLRPVLALFSLAILTFFIIHVFHMYELLYLGYNEFSRADAGLTLVGALLVGGAQTTMNILNRRTGTTALASEHGDLASMNGGTSISQHRKSALPSILVLIFGLLIFLIWLSGGQKAFPGQMLIVYAGGFSVLILMLLRQLLTFFQINTLRNQLQKKNTSLSLLNLQLERQATTDLITGLPNHRGLVERLDEALADAQTTHSSCALIFMDIDHFKSINDRYGHPAGDEALRQFGALVWPCLPSGACLGRWGGEEFVAILPRSDTPEALDIAEQIRVCVEQQARVCDKCTNVTCSLGVASYPRDASTRGSLIMQADRAMYAAKRLGRNQVRSAGESRMLGRPEAEVAVIERAEIQETVDALLALLEARDYATCQHARRVAALSLKLARTLGLNENEAHLIGLSGLLHDLGKLAVPDTVLHKHGQLDGDEQEHMFRHPLTGAEILTPVSSLRTVTAIVRAHHERMDGSGYPDGLRSEEIPLGARIIAVADTYDAITSQRVYSLARSSNEALRELRAGSGTQFDPGVVEALARLLAAIPHRSKSGMM